MCLVTAVQPFYSMTTVVYFLCRGNILYSTASCHSNCGAPNSNVQHWIKHDRNIEFCHLTVFFIYSPLTCQHVALIILFIQPLWNAHHHCSWVPNYHQLQYDYYLYYSRSSWRSSPMDISCYSNSLYLWEITLK